MSIQSFVKFGSMTLVGRFWPINEISFTHCPLLLLVISRRVQIACNSAAGILIPINLAQERGLAYDFFRILRLPFIHCAVQILPLALNIKIRLVRATPITDSFFVIFTENRLQQRRKLLNLAVNVGMVNERAALGHLFFQVAIAG